MDNIKNPAKKPKLKKSYSNSTIFQKLMVDDVRNKILFTILCLLIYRLGCGITIPFVNTAALQTMFGSTSVLDYYNLVSGGALSQCAVFAIGVSAYINASIIIQLLTVAIPKLEEISKDIGGQKQINKITQYVGCGLAAVTAIGYFFIMKNYGAMKYTSGISQVVEAITVIAILTAGSQIVIWLGWLIDEKGFGNGISLILFAGIVARIPTLITRLITYIQLGEFYPQYYVWVPLVVILFIAMIAFIVLMNGAERRIPVQYAKRIVGRKQYGGQNTYMPIKVNMSGVLPIIFAQSIAMIIPTVAAFLPAPEKGTFGYALVNAVDSKSVLYMIVYFLMIIAFSYFYATIQFNPVEISNNLKKNGGFIPGFRPGKPTADFIKKVLNKVTLFGAIYLGVVAILPLLIGKIVNVSSLSIGGTSVIIVVGVALETVQALESQMLMRQYKGFLE